MESKRVDYALRLGNKCRVFLEVKKPGEDLDNESHQEQLLLYSFRQSVDLAVLTNGVTWCLYLPKAHTDWRSRKFYTVDILAQETLDAASKLVELLSKENVRSGEALQRAEKIRKGKQKTEEIRTALPGAWNKIISEPDSLLVDLLAETTERISGYKPDLSEVTQFLKRNEANLLLQPPDETSESRTRNRDSRTLEAGTEEPPDQQKISQKDLIPHIVAILKRHGGRARKKRLRKRYSPDSTRSSNVLGIKRPCPTEFRDGNITWLGRRRPQKSKGSSNTQRSLVTASGHSRKEA